MIDNRLVEMHAVFEASNPDEAEMARLYENHREAMWLRSHDTLDGYKPRREFPCIGAIRVVAENDSHLELQCDVCGFETSCRREPVASTSQEW